MEVRLTLQKLAAIDFRVFHVIGIEVTRQAMAGNGRKMAVRLKWQKFAENSSHRFPRVVRSGHRGRKKEVRLKNGKNGRKRQKMDFCVFRVVVIEVARQAMAENGRKWSIMDFRGKMVENGFLRVSRHFPTTYSAFEPIIKSNTRYHELTSPDEITDWQAFKEAEDDFMTDINDPLTNFDAQSIAQNLDIAGFSDGDIDVQDTPSTYVAQKDSIIKWFDSAPSPDRPTSRERFLKYFDEKKVNNYILEVQKALGDKTITVNSKTIFIRATK